MTATDSKTYGRLITVAEAAEWLSVPANTIRWWIQLGRIESHDLYGHRRIYEDEVIRLIEESRVPARRKQLAGAAA